MPTTDTIAALETASSLLSKLRFHLQVSRPGLWLTAVWFYLLPLGGKDVFFSWRFWLGVFFVSFPLGYILYGWNDFVDTDADQINPRKGNFLFGARGNKQQLRSLPWTITAVHLPFLVFFFYMMGAKALLWYFGLVSFSAIYNWPKYGFKSQPPFEVLNQAGYVLVFVLSSWLNGAPQLPWQTMLFGAMFAMHSHIFGEIMDVVPDRLTGRHTTATQAGTVPAKFAIVTLLALEAVLVFYFFRDPYLTTFLAASAVWFMLDALVIWKDRVYSPVQMKFVMLAWNAVALASIPLVWKMASLTRLH